MMSADMVNLEGMIDRTSLKIVLGMLVEICSLKAEHIEHNWQDEMLARDWAAARRELLKAESKVRI